jgi:hypothetical protein
LRYKQWCDECPPPLRVEPTAEVHVEQVNVDLTHCIERVSVQDLLDDIALKTSVEVEWLSEPRWKANPARGRWMIDKCRMFFMTHLKHLDLTGHTAAYRNDEDLGPNRKHLRKEWVQLTPEMKHRVGQVLCKAGNAPEYVCDDLPKLLCKGAMGKGKRTYLGKTILLTWMGPWTTSVEEEPTAFSAEDTLEEVCVRLRTLDWVTELWKKLRAHGVEMVKMTGAADHALCLEVCPETYELRKVIRLHLHMSLRGNRPMFVPSLMSLAFGDTNPVVGSVIGGLQQDVRSSKRANWSNFFYCTVEKRGRVFTVTSRRAFKDFQVQANWVLNLLQSEKITEEQARGYLALCVGGSSRCMADLNTMAEELQRRAYRRLVAETDVILNKTLCPCKTFPEVQDWLEQYEAIRPRYKFLVLTGASGLGKTMFARTLAAPKKQTLELNCASDNEPDLRAYSLSDHDVVIFDEISAHAILKQKKLFQCSNSIIELGCSTTNCHAYTVLVHRKKFVIATNTWNQELEGMSKSRGCDADWLRANSVVLYVTEPMWEHAEDDDGPPSSPPMTNPWDVLSLPVMSM